MNVKKKGILKGFKYFSQIFDEEESKEIQIGMPTDVKHVAHIGWDGPSANPPTWMDGFKQTNGGYQSAPLDGSGSREMEVSEDRGHKSHSSNPTATDNTEREKDMPGLPKASRRHQSMDSIGFNESPPGSPTGARKQKDRDSKSVGGRRRKEKSGKPKEGSGPSAHDDESPSQSVPSIPKKSRRKKSKDPDSSSKQPSKSKQSKNGSFAGSEDGGSMKSTAAALEEEEEE